MATLIPISAVPDQTMTYDALRNAINAQGYGNAVSELQNAAFGKNFAATKELVTQFGASKITARQFVAGLTAIAQNGSNGAKESWLMWGVVAGLVLWFASKRRKR